MVALVVEGIDLFKNEPGRCMSNRSWRDFSCLFDCLLIPNEPDMQVILPKKKLMESLQKI